MKLFSLRNVSLFFGCFIAVLHIGCDMRTYTDPAKKQTEKYYRWLGAGNTDSLVTLFSREFYTVVDTNALINILKRRSLHGQIISAERTDVSQNITYSGDDKNIEISIVYKVTFSSGEVFAETFSFVSGEPFSNRIYGLDLSKWKDG